jgi:hypothetical protein
LKGEIQSGGRRMRVVESGLRRVVDDGLRVVESGLRVVEGRLRVGEVG